VLRSFRKKVHPSSVAEEFADVWVELANDIYGDFCHFVKENELHIEANVNEQQGEIFALVAAICSWVVSASKFNSSEYTILLPYLMDQIKSGLVDRYDWHPTTDKFALRYDDHLRTLQDRPSALSERVGKIINTGSEFGKALYGEKHTLESALAQMMLFFYRSSSSSYPEVVREFSGANYNNYWWFVKEGRGTIKHLSSSYKLL
jgi:hypothetical protein